MELTIAYVSPGQLQLSPTNARTHSPQQIKQIERSMREFGFMNPLLVDGQNRVIAGHGRLMAAKNIGLSRVPVVRIEHLSEAQRRAYALADNKLALNAGWDTELLKVELSYLMQTDIDFSVDLTGFSTPEIDLVMQPAVAEADDPVPELPSSGEVVTRPGDVWIAGDHRIACGDCRDSAVMAALLCGQKARMVLTDPPFNVPIEGHVSGLGKNHHAEFAMGIGEMSTDEFVEFLRASIGAAADSSVDGALLYAFMDWRHLLELQTAYAKLDLQLVNLCVWAKTNAGMGSLYRSQHELVLIGKKGKAPHINNVELGKHGRYRTNVWTYAGMNTFGAERDEALAMHPTVKPIAMIADAIQDVTHHGDMVLDVFLGSGTTLMAAHKTKRRCYGVEIDPGYVDVALARWVSATDLQPVLISTGRTFEEMREVRGTPAAA